MAQILSRLATIEQQIRTCEDLYQVSHKESERRGLQKEMSKLTTEYLRLSKKLA